VIALGDTMTVLSVLQAATPAVHKMLLLLLLQMTLTSCQRNLSHHRLVDNNRQISSSLFIVLMVSDSKLL